ncbi:hypothetical protein GJ496_008128 [Pomphorhynchus laevis]|nr:hypothetical protein GJ496_008128 [Pomphorhynchus laevis]
MSKRSWNMFFVLFFFCNNWSFAVGQSVHSGYRFRINPNQLKCVWQVGPENTDIIALSNEKRCDLCK